MLFILLLIPNQFGTVIELGVQGLETLEQLEIQYRKAEATQCLARSTHVHSVPETRIALLRLLSRCYSLYKNINSTTTLVHRTMGTHVKVIPP